MDSPVNNMWAYLKSSLSKLIANCVPSKISSTRYNQPWTTTEIKRLSSLKQRQYNKAKSKSKTSKEY